MLFKKLFCKHPEWKQISEGDKIIDAFYNVPKKKCCKCGSIVPDLEGREILIYNAGRKKVESNLGTRCVLLLFFIYVVFIVIVAAYGILKHENVFSSVTR